MTVLSDLRDRLSSTHTLMGGISDRLRSVALGAARGDAVAVKAAEKLNADRRKAEDDAAILSLAIEQAEADEQAERERQAAAREAERIAEVERVSSEVVAAAAVADDACQALVGALRRRREALRKLPRLGVPSSHLNRLDRDETVARALRHHGMRDFTDLPGAAGVQPDSIRPLAELDKNLLGTP